jgi:glycosyltransferase involved in cell wall biosynthesis
MGRSSFASTWPSNPHPIRRHNFGLNDKHQTTARMRNPKVSVGLPVFNGEKYLKQSLDSLLGQNFQDFELIISDNASTDGTAELCQAYAAKDRRIRYYRNEFNVGAVPNYIRVFELSRGEFFKWCSHDDVCLRGFLSRCYETMEAAPPSVVLVYPQCQLIDEFGGVIGPAPDCIESKAKYPHQRLAMVLRRLGVTYPLWGLIRTDALHKIQLTGTVFYWDALLLIELSLIGQIWEVSEVLSQQRCHPGNSLAICSSKQGDAISTHPDKLDRKTRQALRAWTDASAKSDRIWLPIHEERYWEYAKRIHHARLTASEAFLCYFTLVAVSYWRRFRTFGGYWKRRLTEGTG